jgi:hypothetical protein
MRISERILRTIAAVVATIAAVWALRSLFRDQQPSDRTLGIILIRVAFYSFFSLGFLMRTLGARWRWGQWLGCALLFGVWLWDGRVRVLTMPALAAGIGLTLVGAILERRSQRLPNPRPEADRKQIMKSGRRRT